MADDEVLRRRFQLGFHADLAREYVRNEMNHPKLTATKSRGTDCAGRRQDAFSNGDDT
jgi:hypothetical protein